MRYHALIIWAFATSIALGLLALIFGAPVALARGDFLLAETIYHGFSHACHQIPERSFYVAGHPLAVCARCAGLYIGCALGLVSYPLVRPLKRTDTPPRRWLIAAAVPTTVDFGLGFFGLWENTHWSRALTAGLLGVVTAFYLVPGLVDAGQIILWRRRPGRAGEITKGPAAGETSPASEDHAAAPADYAWPASRVTPNSSN